MVPCKHCNTLNSLDSTFCKRCGTGLPDDQLDEARAELEKVVDEGFAALDQNRVEEAFAVACSATAKDPSSTRALSLKASCHERRSEVAEALECAERIVELNPNSELDKIKRNQLRSALAASVQYGPLPGKGVAALAGFAACVLVFCAGVVIARRPDTAQAATRVASNVSPTGTTDAALDPNRLAPQPGAGQNSRTSPSNQDQGSPNQNQGGTQPPATQEDPSQDQSPATAGPVPVLPHGNSRTLPQVDPSPGTLDVVPVQPSGPIPSSTSNSNTPKSAPKSDPSGDPTPQAENGAAQSQEAQPNPGEIHISVSRGGSKRIGASGSTAVPDSGGGSTMYSRMGNEQFQMGNYSGAANAFEQALRNGGDPIELNLRLGRAYQNQGRTSEALGAYQHAIDASNSALSSGKGNTARIQAIKGACEQAVSVLHGG